MSGETEAQVSAWTIDSLRHHLEILLKERDDRYTERFETAKMAIQAALAAHEAAAELAHSGIKQFYDTILTERDLRYDERFVAQEKAVVVALAGVNREFHEHLQQVREETRIAMEASDKAITKSENANEKRFESVNEFRAQQADMIQTFARKTEIDQRLAGLSEKVDVVNQAWLALGGSTMPRAEYDRAHTDLVERVLQMEKSFNEKLEAQAKAYESRIQGLQAQLSSIQAVTG